jgi:hypothetical protein
MENLWWKTRANVNISKKDITVTRLEIGVEMVM